MKVWVFLLLLPLPPSLLARVVGKFSEDPECLMFFINGKPPTVKGILEDGTIKDQNRYAAICQENENQYRFATLYNKIQRIPMFSAYKLSGTGSNDRDKKWRTEPGLGESQATNNDYKGSIEAKGVNRGHLFANSHATDQATAKSTFTLTNIVPQNEKFNGGRWNQMEQYVKRQVEQFCLGKEAYAVTGAIPSDPPHLLNDKVNIPKLLWTALCCKNNTRVTTLAHYGENIENAIVHKCTLNDLEKILKENGLEIDIFNGGC